jgi:O-antigen/teichoic acid export membrane protein
MEKIINHVILINMLENILKKIQFWLKWSEKYTKTDMVYLASSGLWINISQGFSTLSGLILVIALGNILPPETYGNYKFILSVVSILCISSLNGMSNAIVRSVSQGNESTIYPAIVSKAKWSIIGSIGSLFLSGYYFFINQNIEIALSFIILSIFIPFINSSSIWRDYLNGKKLYKDLGIYDAVKQIVKIVAVITTILLTRNILIIIFVYFGSEIIIKIILLIKTIKKYPPNEKIDVEAVSYGKHLSLMGVLSVISAQIDKILIFSLISPAQLAIYSFSLRPIQEIKAVLLNLMRVSLPKLSTRTSTLLQETIPRKMLVMFFALLPITIFYIFIAPIFYKLVLPQYINSVFYSQIFAVSILFFPKNIIEFAMVSQQHKKSLYISKTTYPIFKILLLPVLMPFFGILGLIYAQIVTEFFHLILLSILFFRNKKETIVSI